LSLETSPSSSSTLSSSAATRLRRLKTASAATTGNTNATKAITQASPAAINSIIADPFEPRARRRVRAYSDAGADEDPAASGAPRSL
jgi:hypothetical protein